MKNAMTELRNLYTTYLSSLSIGRLRAFGRNIGVAKATTKKKELLITEIIGVLTGEMQPIQRTNLGAPVKDDYVDPKIFEEIKNIYRTITENYYPESKNTVNQHKIFHDGNTPTLSMAEELAWFQQHHSKETLRVADPQGERMDITTVGEKIAYKGQLETLDGVARLLPLNCIETPDSLVMPIELIRRFDLREGDVIACTAGRGAYALVATEILTINGLAPNVLTRGRFDEIEACYPKERIRTYESSSLREITAKYFQWLIAIGKGQRGCIVGPPKTGKTCLLYELTKTIISTTQDLDVLALLIDQSPETVSLFRKILPAENLVYTTYDDEPERQVFVAEFLLKRAKRLAETGRNVVLFVDSLSALARAFNDTDASLGGKTLSGGMESKTIYYIKKYFGAARCLEGGGSLTMLGTASCQTGNPADDLICAELSAVGNLEIPLNEKLAIKRLYPAIDLAKVKVKQGELLSSDKEEKFYRYFFGRYFPQFGLEMLYELVQSSTTYEQFTKKIIDAVEK